MAKDPLEKVPLEVVLWATTKVDDLFIAIGENWILHDAGYVKAFGMMHDDNDLLDYEMMRTYLFKKRMIDPHELVRDALNLIRNGR